MRRFLKRNILRFLNLISPEKEKLLFILLYHSIKDEDFYLCIKKKDFIKQLEFIKENFDILSLEETKLWLCNKIELKRSSVVLTFDDGYEDNLTEVAPLLERFNIKATIFIAPYYKHQTLKTLSFSQIKELADCPFIEIGSHTLSHKILTLCNNINEIKVEIKNSKKLLEDLIKREIRFFAYPKGKYNDLIKNIVKESGYKLACTTYIKSVRKNNDIFTLPRIFISNTMNLVDFKLHLSKGLDILYRLLYSQR